MVIKVKAPTWKNITGAYVRRSTWSPIKQIYVKVVNTWKSVFLSDPPVIVSKPSFRLLSYSGAAATSPQFLDQSLYGKDGSYNNYTGITGRKITYSDTSDGLVRNTIISGDLFTTGAGITTSDRLTVDGKYLFYELTVSNGTDVLDSIEAVSDPMLMIKKQPALGSFTTALTGQSSPNSVLTFNYSLENYYYNRIVPSTSKIRWWRSTNTTASGVIVKEETISATTTSSDSSGLMGTSTYTVAASNDNNSYIVVEIIGVSSWTTNNGYGGFFPDYQIASYSSGVIQAPYQFSFGNTLYVGSNGYIGLNNGGNAAGLSGSGRNINIWNEDLVQYKLQEYSDSSNYYLYFRAYRYQSPLVRSAINALDYQIKFYTGQPYCDVYLVRKGSSVPAYLDSPGYYKNFVDDLTAGNTSGVLGPFAWTAGSVMRIYFNETTSATTSGISWTTISDAVWKDISSSDIDDSFTSVVTSANQSAPIPVNTVLPTLTTDTGNFSAGSTITVNAGTWTNTNSYAYELLWGAGTPISDTSTNTKILVSTNTYVITNADATASSYYFRGRVTAYAGSGQTGASTIALSATSSRSYINSTTTISVGTATSSGFTISGTASPPVYTSISSIQIFNSSQTLISTITTGLPAVNSTTGAWSYIWTGGSSSTTYYAKVTVIASDSAVTTFTTGFSSSIATSAGVSTPTALSATNNSGAIRLTFSGGSGSQYDIYYGNSSTRPTDGQAFADYENVTSPYDPPLTARNQTRYFWVRKSTGSVRSNWYPYDSSVSIRLPLLAPPTPVITNSAQSSSSLSWHWTQPTPSASQDEPTSWDYNISTSTATPGSWTNTATRPTAGSPLVTGSLTASATYYLHVKAKNADNSTTTYQSGATTAASVSPSAPTGLSVSRSVGSDFLNTSLSPSASGNSSKTQTWSFGRPTTFTVSFTRGSNATSSEMYYGTSSSTPASSTGQNGGTNANASGSFSYVGAASTSSGVDTPYYFWVRSTTATENSAWTYAGTQNVDTPVYTGFSIVLYRTSVGNANFSTQTPSRNDLSYTWTGVSTSFSHQAQVRLTFDGTARTANS